MTHQVFKIHTLRAIHHKNDELWKGKFFRHLVIEKSHSELRQTEADCVDEVGPRHLSLGYEGG